MKQGELPPLVLYAEIDLPESWLAEQLPASDGDGDYPAGQEDEDALGPSMTSSTFNFEAFGRGLSRIRQLNGLSIWQLADLAGVNKDTVRIAEAGKPCTERTRHKLRSALNMSLQRLNFGAANPEDPIAIYHPGDTKWWMSRDWRKLSDRPKGDPAMDVDLSELQKPTERRRLGSQNIAPRFILEFSCDLFWSPVYVGLMESIQWRRPKNPPWRGVCLRNAGRT